MNRIGLPRKLTIFFVKSLHDKNDLEKQIHDLQEKIHILQVENDHLAERAEDTLLLGLVGEKINSVEEIDEVLVKTGIPIP